jgi:hypothetical protein
MWGSNSSGITKTRGMSKGELKGLEHPLQKFFNG